MKLSIAFLLAPVCLLAQSQEAPKSAAPFTATANSDPNYRALRDGQPAESFNVENVILKRDAGVITLESGGISFLPPVLGRTAAAVFTGRGRFQLKAAVPSEAARLQLIYGAPEVDEEFTAALFYFTDTTADEIRKQCKSAAVPAKNEGELQKFRTQLRARIETPRSNMEALLFGSNIPNIEAEVLGDLYNSAHAGSFMAFLRASKHPQLRFLIRPQGALPAYGPEEVALVNVDPADQRDGLWYLGHTEQEIQARTASSSEDRRAIAPEHYQLDVRVGRHDRLSANATVRFKALRGGERVIGFNLLPNLRVSRVALDGVPIGFIQEKANEDGALAVVLPQPAVEGHVYALAFEYEGNKVIYKEGRGNYAVGARENWYPTTAAFRDRATYDITFHTPKNLTLVGVGKQISEKREGDELVTEWRSEEPLGVAGFNFGEFKKKAQTDDATKYALEVYATSEVPDFLKALSGSELEDTGLHEGMDSGPRSMILTPSAMADRVLVDASNSVRLFTVWYGPAPFGRLAVTQQPAFSFGQSWPTLVYLPVSAFLDPTQRWRLLGHNTFRFSSEFINVVTAHEVAHQWWGHTVGWATSHDAWLSEGFADFSAGLFLQFTQPASDAYHKFWESERRLLLERNQFGYRANDAGPLWMSEMLAASKLGNAGERITYAKGAYVLHMLRSMMRDKNGDKDFMDMMHDFAATYRGKCATTEDFQHTVEKHMKPELDLDRNGSMDWFFQEWVYRTEVPSYHLDYNVADAEGGKALLTLRISQQGVSPSFKMRVPIYIDYEGRWVKMGTVPMVGSSTTNEIKVPLVKRPRRVMLNAENDVLAIAEGQK